MNMTSSNETLSPAALLRANMAHVFNERDAQRRLAAVRELYADGATLYEPQTAVSGHEAISAAVGELLATLPADMMFTPTGAEDGHHGLAFARWQGGPADGPAVVTGMDVAHFEGGRITALYVFLDAPAQEEPS
jgi:hypothetical protein